ncbi:MAG: hypothetical protein ACFFDW_05760 [Candidatus Thorarchaeota archaeon]
MIYEALEPMIQFVWVIIQDTPVTGMRFIKISNEEEKERLQKFYGWLSGPIREFGARIQDIILDETKYYYHSNREVLFVVGTDLEEENVPVIFIPELEQLFFEQFSNAEIAAFDGKDIQYFRSFDTIVLNLVKAFTERINDSRGQRKNLDAFEVLNLPNELQMVALVLVKMQVVTPDIVSQVSGLTPIEVERQLNEIYQRGYLYLTTISNKSYFSIKPFGSEESTPLAKRIKRDASTEAKNVSPSIIESSSSLTTEDQSIDVEKIFPQVKEKTSKFSIDDAEVIDDSKVIASHSFESAMMAPPGLTQDSQDELNEVISDRDLLQDRSTEESSSDEKSVKKELKGIKFKEDLIAQEIDKKHELTLLASKNGFLPAAALRRERGFQTGKIRIPNDKNKDPFLLNSLLKKDIENVYEALLMGDLLVLASDTPPMLRDDSVTKFFDAIQLITPHRELKCISSDIFVHPKDADVIFVPKHLLKYYSWATVIDLDQNKVLSGNATDFSKNLVKKIRKITDSKELLKEITQITSVLVKVGRDINTLKIEGRSPDLYLNEVRKTFGVAVLEAGLTLSERLIRLHKDCAYFTGYYIRKNLDIVVKSIIIGEPVVIFGDDPLDVYHLIESLTVFSPHKAIKAQIWTTNLAGINTEKFDIIGAQEGTDKLFKDSVKVNLRSMSAYGGTRSEFIHTFVRQMWRRRSKDRPKFIKDTINAMIEDVKKILHKISNSNIANLSKQDLQAFFDNYPEGFSDFVADIVAKDNPELAEKMRQ